jgi:hypothetical protein
MELFGKRVSRIKKQYLDGYVLQLISTSVSLFSGDLEILLTCHGTEIQEGVKTVSVPLLMAYLELIIVVDTFT